MQVAIIGSATDIHSEVVRWSLEQGGVSCGVMDTLYGLHNHHGASLMIDREPSSRGGFCNASVRSAWYRRHHKVRSPSTAADDDNRIFRTSECNIMQENIVATLAADPAIAWVNNPVRARVAENKFLQLIHAKKSGLPIPATLMSAEPEEIRRFATAHDFVVVKPFGVYSWEHRDRSRTYALARKVESARVINSSDGALSNTPAIYQVAVDKVSDLRVVVIGADVYAYNIVQSGDPDFDCRFSMTDPKMASIEEYALSARQKGQVLEMMRSLDMEMASADFALTADGDIVFLDLNPAGAWLFLEQRVPGISLTTQVCRLLAAKAKLDSRLDFPGYEAFAKSSALEAFGRRYRFEADHGVTVKDDRTWIAAA